MYPNLFKIPIPGFMQGFLPEYMEIHTYGLMIAIGILLGYMYTTRQAYKQFGISKDIVGSIILYLIIAGIVGGKIFFYFEDPSYYFANPGNMLKSFGSGFVFYGSLLFAIPTMIYLFRKYKLPTLEMLDIMAVTTCITHACGRLGCFFAGCCHGLPHHGFLSVTFTDPACSADPLNTPLYPTQLFSVFMILSILGILLFVKKYRQFNGQLFLIYLATYAVGRSIIEIFRGDIERGFIIKNIISHSQFISIIIITGVVFFYFFLKKRQKKIAPLQGRDS